MNSICSNCMTVGRPAPAEKKVTDHGASILVLILGIGGFFMPLLWIAVLPVMFIGLILSLASRAKAAPPSARCSTCHVEACVPITTPRGQELLARLEQQAEAAAAA